MIVMVLDGRESRKEIDFIIICFAMQWQAVERAQPESLMQQNTSSVEAKVLAFATSVVAHSDVN